MLKGCIILCLKGIRFWPHQFPMSCMLMENVEHKFWLRIVCGGYLMRVGCCVVGCLGFMLCSKGDPVLILAWH